LCPFSVARPQPFQNAGAKALAENGCRKIIPAFRAGDVGSKPFFFRERKLGVQKKGVLWQKIPQGALTILQNIFI